MRLTVTPLDDPQVQQKIVALNSGQDHIPLFDRNTTISSSRPAVWQSTARKRGGQGRSAAQ